MHFTHTVLYRIVNIIAINVHRDFGVNGIINVHKLLTEHGYRIPEYTVPMFMNLIIGGGYPPDNFALTF